MTRWLEFFTELSSANTALAVSDWALRATLVLSVAALMTWMLRGRSAALRHLVWAASLASVLLLPLASLVAPGWSIPGLSLIGWAVPTDQLPGNSLNAHGTGGHSPPYLGAASDLADASAANLDELGMANRFSSGSRSSDVLPFLGGVSKSEAGLRDAIRSADVSGGDARSTKALSADETAMSLSELVLGTASAEVSMSLLSTNEINASGAARTTWASVALSWSLFVWLAGVVAMMVPLAGGFVSLAQLKRSSLPLPADLSEQLASLANEMGIDRSVVALLSTERGIPMTWGLVVPKLLLPADAASWDVERRRMVLLHELAHIARGDFATQLVGQVARAVQWFNPLAWYGLSRLRLEQERACDDIVLNAGAVAEDYATELLGVTSRERARTAWDCALALAMSQPSRLEDRLKAILDPQRDRQLVTTSRRDFVLCMSVIGLMALASAGRVSRDSSSELAANAKQFANPVASPALVSEAVRQIAEEMRIAARDVTKGDANIALVAGDHPSGERGTSENTAERAEVLYIAQADPKKEAAESTSTSQGGRPESARSLTDQAPAESPLIVAQAPQTAAKEAKPAITPTVPNADFEGESDNEGHPAGWFATILPATKDFVEFKHSDGGREVAGRAGKKCVSLAIKARHPDTPIHYNWLVELKGWEPGKSYAVSAWVKTQDVKTSPFIVVETLNGDSHPVSIHTSNFEGVGKPIDLTGKLTGTHDWTKLTCLVRVAPTAKRIHVRLGLPSMENRSAQVWFDDVTVEPTSADVPATHFAIPEVPQVVSVPNPALDLVRAKIEAFSAKPVDPKALTEGAVKGMLEVLKDEYSTVLTAEQLSALSGHMSLVGIGVQIAKIKEGDSPEKVVVLRAFASSPAAKAGVKPQDQLLAIDDKAITSLEMAVNGIRGVAGSSVKLKLRRGDNSVADVTVVREVVSNLVEPVTGLAQDDASKWRYWLDTNAKVGYVHLTQFTGTSAQQLEAVVKGLQAEGLKGLVLDLRGNMGGVLPDCVNTASLFIKEGQVVRYQERAKEEQSLGVSGKAPFADLPLIVVVDGTTASAAEVLAGALQDHGRAVLVGDRTFGKGSIQSIHPLGEGGAAIKLTTAYLLTPSGRSINRSPDAKNWGIDPSDGWFVP